MESLIGQIIDNYRILSVIGKGGMGIVYKAVDISIDKVVALKMIDPVLAQDSEFLRRFKTEARALAKLKNPHIVSVHTLRETEKGTFIVMEYANPKNLSDCIREKGHYSWEEALPICRQILDGIAHAHKVGIIHRDIKPSNILVSESREVKITDFGLAKLVQEHGPDSTVAQVKAGTLNYMSPEQIKGLIHVDQRSDIYSIGITIYEMLTGRVPFEKTDSDFTIQKKIVDGNIPSPIKFNSSLSSAVVHFIKKATHKEPSKRFQSAEEMLKELIKIEIVKTDKPKFSTPKKTNNFRLSNKNLISKLLLGIAGLFIVVGIIIIALKETNISQEDNIISTKDDTSSIRNKTIVEKPIESFAKLNISSYPPGGKIFLNGKQIGETATIFDSLLKGSYDIRIAKKNYRDFKRKVVVSSLDTIVYINEVLALIQKPKIIEKEVLKCNLTLQMIPSGNIYIRSKIIASNSSAEISNELNTGKHVIKFEHAELGIKDTTISLIEGDDKVLICYFQKRVNIASLNESGIPFWGSIFINNIHSGETDKTILLDPGYYKVYVKREGCETREDPIPLNITPSFSDEPIRLVFHLRKK